MSEKKSSIFSIGLIRGLLGMLAGYAVGFGLVSVIRLLQGLPVWAYNPSGNQYGFSEPAWVVGAIFGIIGFILALGVVSDWLKWMDGQQTPEHPADAFPSGVRRYLSASYDHKVIGIQYGGIIAGGRDGAYADYVVRDAGHWVYADTGLVDGDVIPGIVGYEADGFDPASPGPSARAGTVAFLSRSPFVSFSGSTFEAGSAVYQAPSGAWVFAAGTIGWSLGLDDFGDRAVPDRRLQQATRNVLDAFAAVH